MRKSFTAFAAVLSASAMSVVGLNAPAYAYSPIRVDNPNGDEYKSSAKIIVTGYNESDYTETLYIECNNSFRMPEADVDPGSFSVSVGSFIGPDTCRIYEYYSDDLLARFTVAAPSTAVSEASVARDTFDPLVRDGYKDAVKFRWRQNHDARATIKVVNSDG